MYSLLNKMKHEGRESTEFVPRKSDAVKCSEPVQITYFTDPLSPTGFAMDIQLQNLLERNPNRYIVDYHMAGLMPIWDLFHNNGRVTQADMAQRWDDAGKLYGMPISGDVWLKDPPNSSFPPSIAFKSAQLQDAEEAVRFLNGMRESLFVKGNNISKWPFIEKEAVKCELNIAQLIRDQSDAGRELFEADLQLADRFQVNAFPTLRLLDPCSRQEATLEGYQTAEAIERSLMRVV